MQFNYFSEQLVNVIHYNYFFRHAAQLCGVSDKTKSAGHLPHSHSASFRGFGSAKSPPERRLCRQAQKTPKHKKDKKKASEMSSWSEQSQILLA